MKKLTAMALVLSMLLSFSACGSTSGDDSSASKKSSADTAAAETTATDAEDAEKETEAETEPAEPLNTNVVHDELANSVLNMKASFDIANIEGYETKAGDTFPDSYYAKGGYGYPDPEYYANAISIDYTLRPMSAHHLEELAAKEAEYADYEKVDLGSEYDTYQKKSEGSYGDRYDLIFVGGSFIDGACILEATIIPQLDSADLESLPMIVETFARSLKLEADDSVLKTADGFSLAQNGITCANKATVAGQQVDMTQSIYTNSNYISASTVFTADDITYDFHTLNVDGMDHFGVMGGGEYADCTIAGKPAKINVTPGIGTIEVNADVQIDDENILHISISSDSAIQQGSLTDAATLGEKFNEMLSDENKAATQEMFAGYISDIMASFTFGE